MLLDNLPLKLLQEELESIPFQDLDYILQEITGEDRKIKIFDDKDFLSKLLLPIQGADKLPKSDFRRKLLQYADAHSVEQFLDKAEISKKENFEENIEIIAKLPWGQNDHTNIFLEVFGFSKHYLPEKRADRPEMETILPPLRPFKQLMDFQAMIVYQALSELNIHNNRFLIQMPTGTGKTRTAVEVLIHFLNNNENKITLWLANREELCEQVIEAFKETWVHTGKKPMNLYRCWGSFSPNLNEVSEGFVVAGFQKLWSLINKQGVNFQPDIIVIDEAHMIIAPTYIETVDSLRNIFKGTRTIGLTATPGRSYTNWEENYQLADYFNKNILTIETKENEGIIEYLQKKKILSIPIREPIYTGLTFEVDEKEWDKLSKEYEYPKSFLKRVAEDFVRNVQISKKLISVAERDLKTLFFACSVEQSKMLCALMVYLDFPAAHVDGSTTSVTRRDIIKKFKTGKIKLLFNYDVFSTGFDVPDIDAIFIARPTSSIVFYSQVIGRGMRGPAVGGTETFVLIDVIDNIFTYGGGLDDIYEFFSEYWGE